MWLGLWAPQLMMGRLAPHACNARLACTRAGLPLTRREAESWRMSSVWPRSGPPGPHARAARSARMSVDPPNRVLWSGPWAPESMMGLLAPHACNARLACTRAGRPWHGKTELRPMSSVWPRSGADAARGRMSHDARSTRMSCLRPVGGVDNAHGRAVDKQNDHSQSNAMVDKGADRTPWCGID